MADEPEMIDEDDALPPSTAEEVSAFAEKLSVLKARCDAAGIEFVRQEREEGEAYAIVSIPAGRAKRKVFVFNESAVDSLLLVEFEKYKFIYGYEAICCYGEKYIEVGLRSTRMAPQYILQRLQGGNGLANIAELKSIEIAPPEGLSGRPVVEIGPCSSEFMALDRGSRITLKLKGARAFQHDQALEELRSYADSLFFQIDMMYGFTFILERERRARPLSYSRRRTGVDLQYPTARYNDEAISLYWYAKSARDMPLLRFLAFYQSIEFYFPRYSQTEARKRIGSIIKHPAFRPHRDDDLDRLISAIQPARSGGLGSERSQLRAVVGECISPEEIREYLVGSKGREEHFSGKGHKTKYHKVPLANKNADLRNDVADRVYDIRCKIVHTKNEHSDDDFPMILPFSEDADLLLHDIDLVEFISGRVLISSSGELT